MKIAQSPASSPLIRARAVAAVALVATIQWAEGTADAPNPYRTRYTYEEVPEWVPEDTHPYWHDKRIPCGTLNGQRLCSAASGAFQWMPDTFNAAMDICRTRLDPSIPAFAPKNQDLLSICWLNHVGALPVLLNGVAIANGTPQVNPVNFKVAIYKASGQWASLPQNSGDELGAYNQGSKRIKDLLERFEAELAERWRTTTNEED